MGRNVEIKLALNAEQFEAVRNKAANGASGPGQRFHQTDTFFHCRRGRLKLREFEDGWAELISYERPDQQGPKTSTYTRVDVHDPAALMTALADSLGIRGVVKKCRELFLWQQTRIHLDTVAGLGLFLELEVVLEDEQSEPYGVTVANALLGELGIANPTLISGAYIDLLECQTRD